MNSHAAAPPVSGAHEGHRAGDFVTLTKPRLNFLVLLTTAAAFALGARPEATLLDLVHTLLGTFLVAGGAAAINQVWERQTDRLMRRTAHGQHRLQMTAPVGSLCERSSKTWAVSAQW